MSTDTLKKAIFYAKENPQSVIDALNKDAEGVLNILGLNNEEDSDTLSLDNLIWIYRVLIKVMGDTVSVVTPTEDGIVTVNNNDYVFYDAPVNKIICEGYAGEPGSEGIIYFIPSEGFMGIKEFSTGAAIPVTSGSDNPVIGKDGKTLFKLVLPRSGSATVTKIRV